MFIIVAIMIYGLKYRVASEIRRNKNIFAVPEASQRPRVTRKDLQNNKK